MRFLAPLLLTVLSIPTIVSAQTTPSTGDVAVTEIMFNPGVEACVTDANGEWFEVQNISNVVLDLGGVFISDATGTANEYFKIPVGSLPPMYPGQRFVFCRRTDLSLNGGVVGQYEYAVPVGSSVPLDKSKVGSTAMQLSNSATAIDGVRIYSALGGAPGSGSQILIEEATYTTGAAPFNVSGSSGMSCERRDPFQTMLATAGPLTNSPNAGQAPALMQGTCGQNGSPGDTNIINTLLNWPTNNPKVDPNRISNSGILNSNSPVSAGLGTSVFQLYGGPGLANQPYTLGFSDPTDLSFPLDFLISGSIGAFCLDPLSASFAFDPATVFDGVGLAQFTIPFQSNPLLIGQSFDLQWLAVDVSTSTLVASNGLRIQLTEGDVISIVCPGFTSDDSDS